MINKTLIIITAIFCITILEIYALSLGIDGALFALVLSAISGLAGYVLPSPFNKNI